MNTNSIFIIIFFEVKRSTLVRKRGTLYIVRDTLVCLQAVCPGVGYTCELNISIIIMCLIQDACTITNTVLIHCVYVPDGTHAIMNVVIKF